MVLCILLLIPVLSVLWSGGLIGLDERIGDRANTLWLHWYATYEWSLFESFGQTNVFLYPEGVDLWAELFNVVDAFIAIPFVWLFGWGPHYSWMIAAIMVANLWAGKQYATLWTSRSELTWLAAFIWLGTSSMWHAIEMGRVLQVMVGVIPLSMWALTRLREQGDWRRGLVAGLCVGLTGSVYLFWGYAFLFLAILWCPWRRVFREVGWTVFAVVGGVIALWNLSHVDGGYLAEHAGMRASFPSLQAAFSTQHFDEAGAILESALPIGWFGWSVKHSVSMLLAFFWLVGLRYLSQGVEQSRRIAMVPIGLGLSLFIVLGMGPYWMTDREPWMPGGFIIENPVYLWMYEYLPLVSRMHWPDRWLPIIACLMLPLVSRGLEVFFQNQRLRWFQILLPVVVLVELSIKGMIPLSNTTAVTSETSQCYSSMKTESVESPILLLPFAHSSRAAVFQPLHQHPIVNPISISYESARWSTEYQAFLDRPLLRWAQTLDQSSGWKKVEGLLEDAQSIGLSHIVYHRGYLQDALMDPNAPRPIEVDEGEMFEVLSSSLGTPDCSDEQIVVWRIHSLR